MADVKIDNVGDLRNDAIAIYEQLRAGNIGLREAKAFVATGKFILNTATAELDYNAYTKSDAKIEFFEKRKS